MTRRLATVLGFVVGVLLAVPSAAMADQYGAIAYSPQDGRWGYSYNIGTRAGAERRALSECGSRSCRVAVWFQRACGALAVAPLGGWGSGWGGTRAAAERAAVRTCQDFGNAGCRIQVWACTDR
jgi:serine/threonine-protein kinase